MKHTLVFHLIGLSKKLQKVIGLKTDSNPLSYSQTTAMLVIDAHGNPSQAEIARMLHLQPATVVTVIDELEKLNLVVRRTQANNRRTYQIQLTSSGENQAVEIKKQTKLVENFLKTQLTKQEYREFSSLIEKLSQGLEKNLSNASEVIKPEGGEK